MVQQLGKYRIIERVGRGGMGVVYKAHDPMLDRTVALKVISSDVEITDELRTRFFREAQACARLNHPNVVTVYDMGDENGNLYIVMEFLEGEELRQIIAQRRNLGLEDKLALMMEVCDGLDYAHKRGIVHRDIKPGNIFVMRDGHIKLLDFGIARIASADAGLTRTGLIMGTLRYMSPEQARGRADHRSDVFSVGAVFYELLTSRPAFPGSDPIEILERLRSEDPTPLVEADASLPAELEEIIGRSLRKDPGERYSDLAHMRADLERLRRHLIDDTDRIRARVRGRLEEIARLQHALTERIGQSFDDETVPVVDERTPSGSLAALDRDTTAKVERLRGLLQHADAVQPGFESARRMFEGGRFDDALSELQRIVSALPDHVAAVELLQRVQDARAAAARARERVVAQLRQAEALLEAGQPQRALDALRDVHEVPASATELDAEVTRLRERADAALAAERARQAAEAARQAREQARHAADEAKAQAAAARERAEAAQAEHYAPAPWQAATHADEQAAAGHSEGAYDTAESGYREAAGAYEAAASAARQAAEAEGRRVAALMAEAATRVQAGQWAEALRAADAVLALRPLDEAAAALRLQAQQGQAEEERQRQRLAAGLREAEAAVAAGQLERALEVVGALGSIGGRDTEELAAAAQRLRETAERQLAERRAREEAARVRQHAEDDQRRVRQARADAEAAQCARYAPQPWATAEAAAVESSAAWDRGAYEECIDRSARAVDLYGVASQAARVEQAARERARRAADERAQEAAAARSSAHEAHAARYASASWQAAEDSRSRAGAAYEREEYAEAMRLLVAAAGEYAAALTAARQARAAEEAEVDALVRAAESLLASGEFTQALERVNKALQLSPGQANADALRRRIDDARVAAAQARERLVAQLRQAEALLERGQPQRAVDALRDAGEVPASAGELAAELTRLRERAEAAVTAERARQVAEAARQARERKRQAAEDAKAQATGARERASAAQAQQYAPAPWQAAASTYEQAEAARREEAYETAEQRYREAARDFEAAANAGRQAAEAEARDVAALLAEGRSFVQAGQWVDAVRAADAVLALRPQDGAAAALRREAQQGQAAAERRRRGIEAGLRRAEDALRAGELERAVELLDEIGPLPGRGTEELATAVQTLRETAQRELTERRAREAAAREHARRAQRTADEQGKQTAAARRQAEQAGAKRHATELWQTAETRRDEGRTAYDRKDYDQAASRFLAAEREYVNAATAARQAVAREETTQAREASPVSSELTRVAPSGSRQAVETPTAPEEGAPPRARKIWAPAIGIGAAAIVLLAISAYWLLPSTGPRTDSGTPTAKAPAAPPAGAPSVAVPSPSSSAPPSVPPPPASAPSAKVPTTPPEALVALREEVAVRREAAKGLAADRRATADFEAAAASERTAAAAANTQDWPGALSAYREAIAKYDTATAQAKAALALEQKAQAAREQMTRARRAADLGAADKLAKEPWDKATDAQRRAEAALKRGDVGEAESLFTQSAQAYREADKIAVASKVAAEAERAQQAATRQRLQAAEEAASLSGTARRSAEQAAAPRYAARTFGLAQQKETDGRQRLDRRDFENAEARLREAARDYNVARQEAEKAAEAERQTIAARQRQETERQALLARQQKEASDMRARALSDRDQAVKAGAEALTKDLLASAIARENDGDRLATAQDLTAARQAYQDAAERYVEAGRRAKVLQEAKSVADQARARMAAEKEKARPEAAEWSAALAQERQGVQQYQRLAFREAGESFSSATELFAKAAVRPPERPVERRPTPSDEVRAVLDDYVRAFETRDLALMQKVRPGLKADELRRLRDSFEQSREYRVSLKIDSLNVTGDQAIVKGRREDNLVSKNGQAFRNEAGFTFRLKRGPAGWVIDTVN